jgi:uncharacterized membrane protein YfcA
MHVIGIIVIGFVAGILSGAIGIGGGIVLVPALVYFLGYHQQLAQGTTLMMLAMPVVGLAVYKYYQSGNVNFKVAFILATGFVVGGYLGASIANHIPSETLKKIFGFIMLLIAIKMILNK